MLARAAPRCAGRDRQAASWLVARVILCQSWTMGNLGGWLARRCEPPQIIPATIPNEVR
jgi:hypothetical protein